MNGIELIAVERQRQITQEGWTPEHDDTHSNREMVLAAICYAAPVGIDLKAKAYVPCNCREAQCSHFDGMLRAWRHPWPWDMKWWKPSAGDPIRDLVKAGALIAAEIDRLQRSGGSPLASTPNATDERLTLRDLDRKMKYDRAKSYRVSGDTICDTLETMALMEADRAEAIRRLSGTPMSAASEWRVRFGHAEILCPPHVKVAAKLAEYPQEYGCPQCAVNHIAELEELITEMYRALPYAARLRFNDTEAGRIFERANMESLRPAFDALAKHAEEQTVAASLPTQAEPPQCKRCGDTRVIDQHEEMIGNCTDLAPCPDCQAEPQKPK